VFDSIEKRDAFVLSPAYEALLGEVQALHSRLTGFDATRAVGLEPYGGRPRAGFTTLTVGGSAIIVPVNVSEGKEQFRMAAIAIGRGPLTPRRESDLHRRMQETAGWLNAAGAVGTAVFRDLLQDPSPHVRFWVATELLAKGLADVRPVLEDIAASGGPPASSAQATLKAYDAGQLVSPFGARSSPPS
jgi:hypothetical protein